MLIYVLYLESWYVHDLPQPGDAGMDIEYMDIVTGEFTLLLI